MNTIESNKLIAEFMGFEVATDQNSFDEISHMQNAVYLFNEDNLPYHKDWNMLMPVVEKIESLGYAVIVKPDAVRIINYNTDDKSYMGGEFICMGSRLTIDQTLIGAFYSCFLQFIKSYNQPKTAE